MTSPAEDDWLTRYEWSLHMATSAGSVQIEPPQSACRNRVHRKLASCISYKKLATQTSELVAHCGPFSARS